MPGASRTRSPEGGEGVQQRRQDASPSQRAQVNQEGRWWQFVVPPRWHRLTLSRRLARGCCGPRGAVGRHSGEGGGLYLRASLPLCCGCVRDWLRAPLPAGPSVCLPLGFLVLWSCSASLPVTYSDVLVPQTLPWAAVTCVRAKTAARRRPALHAG